MSTEGWSPSRRTLLVTGLLLPVSACTQPAAPRPPAPDVGLRAAAVLRERDLLVLYDRALAGAGVRTDALAALRAEHVAHLVALGEVAASSSASPGPASPGPASPGPDSPGRASPGPASPGRAAPQPGVAALRDAETVAAAAHAEAVLGASRGLAGLLAALSAAEAVHASVLA